MTTRRALALSLLLIVVIVASGVVLFTSVASAEQCGCPAPPEPPVIVSPLATPSVWTPTLYLPTVNNAQD